MTILSAHTRTDFEVALLPGKIFPANKRLFPLLLSILLLVVFGGARPGYGQQFRDADIGAFATVGGENSQFPLYADNALGFNFGAFYQAKLFIGAEVRGGTYPISARYSQAPFTAGYRIGPPVRRSDTATGMSPLNRRYLAPFVYFGGGFSDAQDSGTLYLNKPISADWEPCWQLSGGIDRQYQHFSWRIVELSYTRTYFPLHDIRMATVSTGIVYHFR
ncbi:hypothetical protein [Silvibacterium acidisoli]|uniref:hypothetical protein n=1 Tax=Acidobacteriaceae bacterium ZG23-2 TaxID=2883246 RepID=UPI00406C2F0A